MNITGLSKLTVAIYCILFLLFVAYFAINIPYQDDANLLEITTIGLNFKSLISNLFSADSDHIQVYPKLAALVQYKIWGEVNYRQLAIFLNILVIISLYFLVKLAKKETNYLYFLPIFLFVLQPQIFEISFWVLPGLQHAFAILFMLLAIYFLDIHKKFNALSLFFAASATFCTGNGLLAFFGIIYILLIYKKPIWYALGGFIICLAVYLVNYKPSAAVRNKVEIASIIKFQALFWTSPFEVFNRQYLHYGLGILMILGILMLFFLHTKRLLLENKQTDLPIAKYWSIVIFCGGTAVLISLSREYDVIFSRFQFYAFFALAVVYLILLQGLVNPYRKMVGILGGFIFTIISAFSYYANYTLVENISNRNLADTYNWRHYKTMMMVDKPYLDLAQRIYSKTDHVSLKVTDDLVSKPILDNLVKNEVQNWPAQKLDLQIKKDLYPRRYFYDEHFLLISDNFNQKKFGNENWYLILHNKNQNYVLAPEYNETFKANFLKTRLYYESGFNIHFCSLNFIPEHYEILALRKTGAKTAIYNTGWKIDFSQKTPLLKPSKI
jgi:hypothetical protein